MPRFRRPPGGAGRGNPGAAKGRGCPPPAARPPVIAMRCPDGRTEILADTLAETLAETLPDKQPDAPDRVPA